MAIKSHQEGLEWDVERHTHVKSPRRTPQPMRRTSAEAQKGRGQTKEAFPPSLSAGHSFGLGMTRTLGYAIVLILAYHTHP